MSSPGTDSGSYRGRFAPSPTGPLHFGSLVTAVASYLAARSCGGSWLVRMEDVDVPRSVPGAADHILRTLEAFGFEWDEPVVYQSQRTELYRTALNQLRREGAAYPCSCSRREAGTGRYPGTCRTGVRDPSRPTSWRVRDDAEGDFVVLRSDGCFAYQLAVVVDDEDQRITGIVRGADLLESTPRQMLLQRLLNYRTPAYLHIPLVTNDDGEKLSKQTNAPAILSRGADVLLRSALKFLGQPEQRQAATPRELLRAAAMAWSPDSIPFSAEFPPSAPPSKPSPAGECY